jgi:hypothetical protein
MLAFHNANTSVWEATATGGAGGLGEALMQWLPYYMA